MATSIYPNDYITWRARWPRASLSMTRNVISFGVRYGHEHPSQWFDHLVCVMPISIPSNGSTHYIIRRVRCLLASLLIIQSFGLRDAHEHPSQWFDILHHLSCKMSTIIPPNDFIIWRTRCPWTSILMIQHIISFDMCDVQEHPFRWFDNISFNESTYYIFRHAQYSQAFLPIIRHITSFSMRNAHEHPFQWFSAEYT